MSGGTSTTTVSPSPFDVQKADQARLMRMFLMNNLSTGIQGQPAPLKEQGLQNTLQQNKYFSGRMGINPNEPLMKDQERSMTESLTKPNQDLMNAAMKMYMSSNVQGTPSTSSSYNPGAVDYANMGMQIAMLAAML